MRQVNRAGSGALSPSGVAYDDEDDYADDAAEKYGGGAPRRSTEGQFFALVVCIWAAVGLAAMQAAARMPPPPTKLKDALVPADVKRLAPAASSQAFPPAAVETPTPKGGFARKLDPTTVLTISLLATHPLDYKDKVLWSSVTANLQGPRGQKEREVLVKKAHEQAYRAIVDNGGEVWDDASCYDLYPDGCGDWAAREPSECVVNGDMLASCRKTCGYCGAVSMLAKEIDETRERDRRNNAARGTTDGIANLVPKAATEGGVAAGGAAAPDNGNSKLIAEFMEQAGKDRIAFTAEEADAYIVKAIAEHTSAFPPEKAAGADPKAVAEKKRPSDYDTTKECKEVLANGREQTTALRQMGMAVEGAGRGAGGARVLCVVLSEEQHSHTVAVELASWGWKCDGFMAVGMEDDEETGTIELPLGEGRKGSWQQTRAALLHIWRYHVGGGARYDHVVLVRGRQFVVPENLREMLKGKTGEVPRVFGRVASRSGGVNDIYNLGGGGIVLNAAAVRLLVGRLWMGGCAPELDASWWDVMIAKCLRAGDYEKYPGIGVDDENFGPDSTPAFMKQPVVPEDARDAQGRQYFMPFPPSMHLAYAADSTDWFAKYTGNAPGGWKTGPACCSGTPISFAVDRDGQMAEVAAYIKNCLHK